MRLFITTIAFILISCGAVTNVTAQTTVPTPNINAPFVGTWQWVNGNQTFRVKLYLNEEERIRGDYTMLETAVNGKQTIIYKSNKDIGFGHTYGPAIYGNSDGTELKAGIEDVVTLNPNNHSGLSGSLTMIIVSSGNCLGCTTTATWKIKENKDLRFEADNRTLSIPIDIILTKVQ